jgi:hypothetical protein
MLDHRQQIERELIQRCFNHRAVFRIAAASLSKLPVDDLDRKATIVIGCARIRQFEQFPLNGLEANGRSSPYFIRRSLGGGVVLFDKRTNGDWRTASMFAKRIAGYPPGASIDRADPNEQEVFDTARKVLRERGLLRNE